MQHISTFDQIEGELMQRLQTMVYCNAATIDDQQRPRSRVIHAVWEGPTGWFHTMPTSAKVKHLSINPAISLAYIADPFKPVYIECHAFVQNDPATRQRIWELCKQIPEPLGFDPAIVWGHVDNPDYTVVRLEAWRIELYDLLNQHNRHVWTAPR